MPRQIITRAVAIEAPIHFFVSALCHQLFDFSLYKTISLNHLRTVPRACFIFLCCLWNLVKFKHIQTRLLEEDFEAFIAWLNLFKLISYSILACDCMGRSVDRKVREWDNWQIPIQQSTFIWLSWKRNYAKHRKVARIMFTERFVLLKIILTNRSWFLSMKLNICRTCIFKDVILNLSQEDTTHNLIMNSM